MAQASRRRPAKRCSSGSTERTRLAGGPPAARGWACRLCRPSWPPTTGRCAWTARPAAARRSRCGCRCTWSRPPKTRPERALEVRQTAVRSAPGERLVQQRAEVELLNLRLDLAERGDHVREELRAGHDVLGQQLRLTGVGV